VNFSAILIGVALRAAYGAQRATAGAVKEIEVAVVFAAMAFEALLNELAYDQIVQRELLSADVYRAVDRGANGFDRVQAVLTYLFGKGLEDGRNPANDLKLLLQIRNGMVHYRFEQPPKKALEQLEAQGRIAAGWADLPIAWPTFGTEELAGWAYETVCQAAHEVADILEHHGEVGGADVVRVNFDPAELARLLERERSSGTA